MPLIKDGQLTEDRWALLADDEPLPEAATPIIVSLERWQDDRAALTGYTGELGVRLKSDQPPAEIAADIDRLGLVALEFPKFTDGRAYSYARLLRERHGFGGEIRAVGNVLRDQLLFMQRCGIDAFEVDDRTAAHDWLEAFSEIRVFYQPTGDRRMPVSALRHRRMAAE